MMEAKSNLKSFESKAKKAIGLFFGAGAEMGYGLPSGGRFAIEIFRRPPVAQKAKFKEQLKSISKRTQYAANFLPSEFDKKNINVFGKPDFTSLLQSSLEYRREQVLKFLNNFDKNTEEAMSAAGIHPSIFENSYEGALGKQLGSSNYDQEVRLNEKLGNDVRLFASKYYSSFLDILARSPEASLLRRCSTSFLQLLVGCCGQKLASDLNDQVFASSPDDVPIFDDIGGLFQIEVSQAGLAALEIVLSTEATSVDANSPLEAIAGQICRASLEKLFESCLDYQSLIDSHFRYLYEPKASWAKFTKICIFLNVVREYILESMPLDGNASLQDGFYHDVSRIGDYGLSCDVSGTTNYTSFLHVVCGSDTHDVFYLNGSVFDFYDPYLNQIVSVDAGVVDAAKSHILVPLLFTQSGVKPLTSIEMSKRYVTLYERFLELDAVVVIGFGFNGDDGHVNGLFRRLIEDEKRNVFICHFSKDMVSDAEVRSVYQRKLRLEHSPDNLHIIVVDESRRTPDGVFWYEAVSKKLGTL